MKAVVYYENGSPDVLKWEEIEKPVPQNDEVLIKVRAASVNPLDWRMMRGGHCCFDYCRAEPEGDSQASTCRRSGNRR